MKKILLALVVVSSMASARLHLEMVDSNPAADAVMSSLPDTLQLWFSQELEPVLGRIELVGPSGEVELSKAVAVPNDGTSMMAQIKGTGGEGTYRVAWRAAGDDGHPVRGEFSFTIGAAR